MASKVATPPPFVAKLKQLADEAASRRQMESERVREAKRLARLEIRRAERRAAALKRKQDREAKRLADQQRRERAAEAARIRRQAQAAERAEIERIRVELKRVEQERARQRRLNHLCAETYRALALAIWEGDITAVVDPESLNFTSELAAQGLVVARCTALADRTNKAIEAMCSALDQFPKVTALPKITNTVAEMARLIARIQPTESKALSAALSAKAARLCFYLESEGARLDEQEIACRNKLKQLKASTVQVKKNIGLAQAFENQSAWKREKLQSIATRLGAHLMDIGASTRVSLDSGMVSWTDRANVLRQAYQRRVPDVDFSVFSNLDVINIARLANARPLIDSLHPAESDQVHPATSIESFQLSRLDQLEDDLAKLTVQRETLRRKARELAAGKIQIQNSLTCAYGFKKGVMHFERVTAASLEGVTVDQLSVEEYRLVGPVQARLRPQAPELDPQLAAAYQELRWLASKEGREFSTYLDNVFAETAKEGTRTVDLTFFKDEGGNRVEVCRVALDCKVEWPLLHLVLILRGLQVDASVTVDNKTTFQVSW
jgi:hypothetical protein